MKNHSIDASTTVPAMVFLSLSMLSFAGYSAAQNEIDSEPTAETEIICYAAQNQWVCAPADEKQKAHNKAMKLVEKKQASQFDVDSSQVEIKTMDLNNDFDQQVKETPATNPGQLGVLEEQIKDFVPRQDQQPVLESKSVSMQTTADNLVETVQPESSDPVEPESSKIRTENLNQLPVNNSDSVGQFDYWQSNYPEKWSFQVIGTSNRHHLDAFLSRHDLLQSNHSIVKTQVNSADWWVVLVGLYDSREEALNQRDQLPTQLASQAWVRQIKSIMGEAD